MKAVSSIMIAGAAFALAACGGSQMDDSSGAMMAPAANVPAEYTVYFGFDRSDLSSLAAATVNRATEAAVSTSANVSLVGHTDTTGSNAYNQALSEARAATVSAAMTAGGVNPAVISASGRGEMDLAVATADGVREPRNRRVEVTLSDMMMAEMEVAMEAAPAMADPANCVMSGGKCVVLTNHPDEEVQN
jgi:outer membrane protein OmpA-like peptidoglycan-associated protein